MNLFATPATAAGYARSRPAVHPHVIRRMSEWLGHRVPRAIDLGCGAGLSTRPLAAIAEERAGIEPAYTMLQFAGTVAPGAHFVAGQAERLPFAAQVANVITAAGSLNYVDFDAFFPEAARVLAPGGQLFVYDFTAGRSFLDSPVLDEWFEDFRRRYPSPKGARPVSPESLATEQGTFTVTRGERFEVTLPFEHGRYLDYMMTETNVAEAIRQGEPAAAIREWCSSTLDPLFAGRSREVRFHAYLAQLSFPGTV